MFCVLNGQREECSSSRLNNLNWNGTHCKNALLGIEFDVQYSTNLTVVIDAVSVVAVIGSIALTDFVEQSFSYKFTQVRRCISMNHILMF